MKPLNACIQGETVIIQRIHGSSMLRKRLLEMGFLKGKKLLIVRYAPLRDPMEVRLGDALISLRIGEAAGIDVISVKEAGVHADT